MTIKCLAFDLDGTLLLDESKRMDPRTVDSIQRAMAQGMHVVIASGRDKNGCKFVYEPLGLENGNHLIQAIIREQMRQISVQSNLAEGRYYAIAQWLSRS